MKNNTQPTCRQVADILEEAAPLALQESYDNSGWQTGCPGSLCTGVLVCVDPVEERVAEAQRLGCNMIVSHHPLLFHGLKRITGDTVVQRTVMASLRSGVSIYSLHTALDNAPDPFGVSLQMARMLGLEDAVPLDATSGSGAVGVWRHPKSALEAVAAVKQAFGSPVVRCSRRQPDAISKVSLCGGSGSFLIDAAIAAGADMFVTSDTSYHKFVDYAPSIFLADIGHFESEACTRHIIAGVLRRGLPGLNIAISAEETNPITYL